MLPPVKRLRMRKNGDCAATGTLKLGLGQAGFLELGTSGCCTPHLQPTFKAVTFRRAGLIQSCCLGSGSTVYTTGALPTEHSIASGGVPVFVEIPIPVTLGAACTYKTVVQVDVIDLNMNDDGVWSCYVATSGASGPTAFASNGINNAVCSTHVTLAYATYNLTSVGPQWSLAGPVANSNPLSFYIWCPVTGPNFHGSSQKYKNLTASIIAF